VNTSKPAPIISELQYIVLSLRMLSQFGNIRIKTPSAQPQGDGIRHPTSSAPDHRRDQKNARKPPAAR
jgi:hypothetical protein